MKSVDKRSPISLIDVSSADRRRYPSPPPTRGRALAVPAKQGKRKVWDGHTPMHPVVINARLFPPAHTGTYYFQCDCACPDDGFVLRSRQDQSLLHSQPLQHPNLYHQQISEDYTLFFNPMQDQGVTVLNPAAFDLWQQFAAPRRTSEVLAMPDSSPANGMVEVLFDCGLLEVVGETHKPRQGSPQTLSAWLHVTNACNLRCDYCYIDKDNGTMPADVSQAAVDAIFRSAAANGFSQVKLKFAGGEAMLNWQRVLDMEDYARRLSQKTGIGVEAVLLSNGVFVNEEIIAACQSGRMRISISLDGIGDIHDAQRRFINGRGSFAWVDRTIARLIAADVHPFLSITLTNRNAAGLADTVAYALERDLPFNINFVRDNECVGPGNDVRLQDDRIIAALLNAFAVIEDNLPEESLMGYLVDRAQFETPHNRTCSAGQSYLVIDHRGNITKCQMEIERPITNVLADDPLALLRGAQEGVQNLPVEEKEGCRACEWRYWCAGGCPIATYRATGRYDVKSPYCHIYKAIYPEALRLEGLRLLKLADRYGQLH